MGINLTGGNSKNDMDVDDYDRGLTNATVQSNDHFINVRTGACWSVPLTVAPSATDKVFFHITNNGKTALNFTDFRFSSSVVGYIEVSFATGTPVDVSATTLSGHTRNSGSSAVLDATAKSDTGATGLTSNGDQFYIDLYTVNKQEHLRTSSNLILAQGKTLILNWVGATATLRGIVSVSEEA